MSEHDKLLLLVYQIPQLLPFLTERVFLSFYSSLKQVSSFFLPIISSVVRFLVCQRDQFVGIIFVGRYHQMYLSSNRYFLSLFLRNPLRSKSVSHLNGSVSFEVLFQIHNCMPYRYIDKNRLKGYVHILYKCLNIQVP